MTIKYTAAMVSTGIASLFLVGLVHGVKPAHAQPAIEASHERTVSIACDKRLPRALVGSQGGDEISFAVREFPGKTAADLASVRALGKLRDVQSTHPTYTTNVPVLLRDGAVLVACETSGSGSSHIETPAIDSVLLVLPE